MASDCGGVGGMGGVVISERARRTVRVEDVVSPGPRCPVPVAPRAWLACESRFFMFSCGVLLAGRHTPTCERHTEGHT